MHLYDIVLLQKNKHKQIFKQARQRAWKIGN